MRFFLQFWKLQDEHARASTSTPVLLTKHDRAYGGETVRDSSHTHASTTCTTVHTTEHDCAESSDPEKHKNEPPVAAEAYKPKIPFPERLKGYQDPQFFKFLEVFKQLRINIPLVEALSSMPNTSRRSSPVRRS